MKGFIEIVPLPSPSQNVFRAKINQTLNRLSFKHPLANFAQNPTSSVGFPCARYSSDVSESVSVFVGIDTDTLADGCPTKRVGVGVNELIEDRKYKKKNLKYDVFLQTDSIGCEK